MKSQQILPIWCYHTVRLLHSVSTWIMIALVAIVAGSQGLIAEHMPAIMKSLAGSDVAKILASTLPDPSWQQAYTGWMKNLSQIITLAVLTINAIGYATLTSNGDIPFILTKNVQRSHYLATGIITTSCASVVYAIIGATLTWAGTTPIFPEVPYAPVLLASLIWALEIILIGTFQLLAATLKPGIAMPLLAGVCLYLLMTIAGAWEKIAVYSPLGLTHVRNCISTQSQVENWLWPVITSLILLVIAFSLSIQRFNRKELS